MILFHTTPKKNVNSIQKLGLDWLKFAKGKKKGIWLHTYGRIKWALVHIAMHHRCSPEDLVTLPVWIEENTIVTCREGIFITQHPIAPGQIGFPWGILSKR